MIPERLLSCTKSKALLHQMWLICQVTGSNYLVIEDINHSALHQVIWFFIKLRCTNCMLKIADSYVVMPWICYWLVRDKDTRKYLWYATHDHKKRKYLSLLAVEMAYDSDSRWAAIFCRAICHNQPIWPYVSQLHSYCTRNKVTACICNTA